MEIEMMMDNKKPEKITEKEVMLFVGAAIGLCVLIVAAGGLMVYFGW